MPSIGPLPFLVRFAFLWNRFAPRGRGFVPRHVGKLFGPDADYIIRTAHGAQLRMDMANLEVYAPIFNAQGAWEPHVAATCARMLRPGVLRHRRQCGHGHVGNTGDARGLDLHLCIRAPADARAQPAPLARLQFIRQRESDRVPAGRCRGLGRALPHEPRHPRIRDST